MVANLKDAKSRFSELVKRASEGEDILITVRGEPTVRLTAIPPASKQQENRVVWVDELIEAAASASAGEAVATSQEYWDESRSGR